MCESLKLTKVCRPLKSLKIKQSRAWSRLSKNRVVLRTGAVCQSASDVTVICPLHTFVMSALMRKYTVAEQTHTDMRI